MHFFVNFLAHFKHFLPFFNGNFTTSQNDTEVDYDSYENVFICP